MATFDWNWAEAEAEHKYAIRLSSSHARAHQWYATDCLAPMGRLDEALEEIREAQRRDPISLNIARDAGLIYYYRREYSKAMEESRKTLDLDTSFYGTYWILGLAYEQQSMFTDAIAAFQDANRLAGGSPRAVAALAHCLALSGDCKGATRSLKALKDMLKFRYVSPAEIALIYVGLGEVDTALDWLDRACEGRASDLVYCKVDPRLEQLQSDPRFSALLSRLGLGGLQVTSSFDASVAQAF